AGIHEYSTPKDVHQRRRLMCKQQEVVPVKYGRFWSAEEIASSSMNELNARSDALLAHDSSRGLSVPPKPAVRGTKSFQVYCNVSVKSSHDFLMVLFSIFLTHTHVLRALDHRPGLGPVPAGSARLSCRKFKLKSNDSVPQIEFISVV
uniref:MBD domain-containing protein n=1 Tax=Macrostomum lignano TaxID=282301 RepID=A0A1I8F5B5_9PLAT